MNSSFDVQVLLDNPALLAAIAGVAILTYILKGFALWRAGRNNHGGWFVALLILNTLGVLEVIYLLTAGRKRS